MKAAMAAVGDEARLNALPDAALLRLRAEGCSTRCTRTSLACARSGA